jgi:hypothetical protein
VIDARQNLDSGAMFFHLLVLSVKLSREELIQSDGFDRWASVTFKKWCYRGRGEEKNRAGKDRNGKGRPIKE